MNKPNGNYSIDYVHVHVRRADTVHTEINTLQYTLIIHTGFTKVSSLDKGLTAFQARNL